MEDPTLPNGVSLRVMSFNVLLELPAENNIPTVQAKNRMRALCREIRSHAPDLVGVQEDTLRWHEAFLELLPEYRAIRSEEPVYKTTEHCAVLYRKDLICKAYGSHWLTADGTKETVALTVADLAGNGKYALEPEELESLGISPVSPDSVLKEHRRTEKGTTYEYLNSRRMSYAVVEADGVEILHVNTHFQHRGQNASYMFQALSKLRNFERLKQYDLLCGIVAEVKKRYPRARVILTGDFNDVADSDIYRAVSGDYRDTEKLSPRRSGYPGSWNCAYGRAVQGDNFPSEHEGRDGGCIDFCFVQPGEDIAVSHFQTGIGRADVTADGGTEKTIYTSDHLPIIVDFKIQK